MARRSKQFVRMLGLEGGTRRMSPATAMPGASPGTLFARPDADPTTLHYLLYGETQCEAGVLPTLDELDSLSREDKAVLWLDVRGLGDSALLQAIGRRFDVHPLALADLVNVPQRPKTEAYGKQTLCIAHMARCEAGGTPLIEQIGMLFGVGWVLTVQEHDADGDVLDPLRERIRQNRGKIRHQGADYLAYSILDCVVDAYFPALDSFGQHLEKLEGAALARPRPETGQRIYDLKRALWHVRRSAWPMREALSMLHRDDELMTATTRVYLRDAVDHATQVVDLVETYREFAASLMDLYLSSVNNRMNEVVKVLTIISTIFLPLSFIASVYGMNFDTAASRFNMPELRWIYGYPFALVLMGLVALAMLWGFKRAGWLGKAGVADLHD